MKAIAIAVVAAIGVVTAGMATAGEEDLALAKKSGCLNCHAVDAKKVGPSYKDVSAKFKGQSEAGMFTAWKAVKMHESIKAPESDVKSILKWIQTL